MKRREEEIFRIFLQFIFMIITFIEVSTWDTGRNKIEFNEMKNWVMPIKNTISILI